MNTPEDMDTDHIDGDTLNNRKYNLRICINIENSRNRKMNTNNQSGHKGVYWDHHIKTPKWKAFIKVNYKYKHLGYFDDYNDAVNARLAGEKKYFGEYIRADNTTDA